MKVYWYCLAVYAVTSIVSFVYAPVLWPWVLLCGIVFVVCGVVSYTEGLFGKKKFCISKEKRKRIVGIIASKFEYPVCDNCAHYMGCSGGFKFGPPCLDCHNGLSRYEPDEQTREANEEMFNEIEEVLKS